MHSSCSSWVMLPPQPLLLLLLLLLTAAGPTSALTEDEKQDMVGLHNYYRARVSPPASDMLQMVSVTGCPPPGSEAGCKARPATSPFPHLPMGILSQDSFLWSVTESLVLYNALVPIISPIY